MFPGGGSPQCEVGASKSTPEALSLHCVSSAGKGSEGGKESFALLGLDRIP